MLIEKPVTEIVDEKFILHSHITPINSKVVLNKGEAALLYVELYKFLGLDIE